MKNFDVFLIFLAVRLASVLLVQTFYVPDEYWQTLEVAHNLIFKYGYLTWEWTKGIRSYIPPLFIAALYKILNITGLDTPETLIYSPRILQSLLTAYSDLCFYKWSGTKKWAVFCVASSWFWFYTGSRTLINTLECALTTIGLSKFPWPGKGIKESPLFIWIAAFLFFIRPTSAIIWIPICIYHLLITKNSVLSEIITNYLPTGVVVLAFTILLDSICHGSFVVTPYEFLKFNLIQNLSGFYGVQSWHWYLSSGLPSLLGIQVLPFVWATLTVLKNRHVHPNELIMLGTVVFTIAVYSFLPHKEFRFILPLLPFLLYVSSRFLSAWSRKASNFLVWLVAIVIFIGNLGPAWYLGIVHQRGSLDVMTSLREISQSNPNDTQLLFLMPCHSTPLYSHLHVNVSTRFLTCVPNFNNVENYKDEADYFYENPGKWLRVNYPPDGTLPSHIISYDILQPSIGDILISFNTNPFLIEGVDLNSYGSRIKKYKQTHEFFHTSVPLSSRIGKYVVIHKRIDP